MNPEQFQENGLRLRYEAFSNLAFELNKCKNHKETGDTLAAQIKFIIDVFAVQFLFFSGSNKITYSIFRGEFDYTVESTKPDNFEKLYLQRGIPEALSRGNALQHTYFQSTIFDHKKINHLYILPLKLNDDYELLAFFGTKNEIAYSDIDYRFAKLIAEYISNKIIQFHLIQNIEHTNKELADANKQITELNNSLERTVKQRTKALKQANKDLQTIFYRASHDFKSPITTIQGISKLIKYSTEDNSIHEMCSHLDATVFNLNKMVHKLSSLGWLDTDNIVHEEINVKQTIESVTNNFQDQFPEIKPELSLEQTITFRGNQRILTIILENLIENAIQFSKSKEALLVVHSKKMEEGFQITISDYGDGISPSVRDKIFDMYYRGNESSTGNGLGLYIVKKMVEKLNGQIKVESTVGSGSTFKVILPFGD